RIEFGDGTARDGGDATGTATIEQVARVAGVSRSTVSRVLSGGDRVSPAALDAVERAIRELGYVPTRAARSLASRHPRAIRPVGPEAPTRVRRDPVLAEPVSGSHAPTRDELL